MGCFEYLNYDIQELMSQLQTFRYQLNALYVDCL